jgi:hypothetical protein
MNSVLGHTDMLKCGHLLRRSHTDIQMRELVKKVG